MLPRTNNFTVVNARTRFASGAVMTYRPLAAPTYFVSGRSKDPENATKIIASFSEPEYVKLMTEAMDQPPVDLDVVETANVIEPYKKVINLFKEQVFQAPPAIVRKTEIAAVDAERKPITPHLGQIIQGYLGGTSPISAQR